MATVDTVSQEPPMRSNDVSIGKRKRPAGDSEDNSILVNGTSARPEQAMESFQNLLQDLVQLLQE